MQILTVADEIVPAIYSLNIKERFSKAQLVLGCGDLPFYYLEFIVTMLGATCLYVRGNHDGPTRSENEEGANEAFGCISLEGSSQLHHGLLIAGLGGSRRYNNEGHDQYTELQMAVRAWRLVPRLLFNKRRHGRYLDIMLTHAPPMGIHNGPDRAHQGFRTFLKLMDRFSPRYLLHGHIHRSYGFSTVTETHYRNTHVINTAGYRLLEIDPAPVQPVNPADL